MTHQRITDHERYDLIHGELPEQADFATPLVDVAVELRQPLTPGELTLLRAEALVETWLETLPAIAPPPLPDGWAPDQDLPLEWVAANDAFLFEQAKRATLAHAAAGFFGAWRARSAHHMAPQTEVTLTLVPLGTDDNGGEETRST